MVDQMLIKSLTLFARESQANLDTLKTYRDEAMTAMAEGQGSSLVSGSGNGMSFARASGGSNLTVSGWFAVLQQVISRAALGYRGSTSKVRFN